VGVVVVLGHGGLGSSPAKDFGNVPGRSAAPARGARRVIIDRRMTEKGENPICRVTEDRAY
jgi:hypothetical protein